MSDVEHGPDGLPPDEDTMAGAAGHDDEAHDADAPEGEEDYLDDEDDYEDEDEGEEGPALAPMRCGFVALVGAPNAGKSTLLNAAVGSKVSIVSPKVQTTRSRVLGIGMHDRAQILFVDLPGIFTPKKRLERAMVAAAWSGAEEADLVAVLVDASRRVDDDTNGIIQRLKDSKRQAILILNKIDLIPYERLLELAARFNETGVFTDIFMISALTGDGLKDFLDKLAARLPEGPWLFPEDQLSDMPQRLLAAEITREKLFLQLHQELPYAIAVETEAWEEFEDGSVKISQVVYVQRPNQKAIVLGKGGSKIKSIGAAARVELEEILDRRVHVMLFVKVREDWAEKPDSYNQWGLDFNA
ncbi:GTP-binding protein Era [Nitrospirillum amazonense]|uniref:GTPase Era n=2 Tax=Azospirillaceae TaxID=2829815 RepID=A0A560FKF1_9PROT|nr:GTP-binding protein Era [Nitrospirillum amazonense]